MEFVSLLQFKVKCDSLAVMGTIFTHLVYTVPATAGVRFLPNYGKFATFLKAKGKCAPCAGTKRCLLT